MTQRNKELEAALRLHVDQNNCSDTLVTEEWQP
jgi:hypothetical protein